MSSEHLKEVFLASYYYTNKNRNKGFTTTDIHRLINGGRLEPYSRSRASQLIHALCQAGIVAKGKGELYHVASNAKYWLSIRWRKLTNGQLCIYELANGQPV